MISYDNINNNFLILKVSELMPDNCCFLANNTTVFSEVKKNKLDNIIQNKCGTLANDFLKKECFIDSNFWNGNINKYIIVTKNDPKNGYKNFAKYNDDPVWFATNNILEYNPHIFDNDSEAQNYVNKYMLFNYSIKDFPPIFSCVKIDINNKIFKPINSEKLGLCGLNDNFWEFYNGKIAVISYLPTFNFDNNNLEPFAYYKNQLIWIYDITDLTDRDLVMEKIVIPLNISLMWKWRNNNINNICIPFMVYSNMINILDNCKVQPESCNISDDLIRKIDDKKYSLILYNINNINNNGTLYDKKISIQDISDDYDLILINYLNFNINIILNYISNESKKILEHYKDFMINKNNTISNEKTISNNEKFELIETFQLVEPPPFRNNASPKQQTSSNNRNIGSKINIDQEAPRTNNGLVSAPVAVTNILPILPPNNNDSFKKYDDFMKKRLEFIKSKQSELKYLEMFNLSCFMVVIVFLFIIFGGYIFLTKMNDKD